MTMAGRASTSPCQVLFSPSHLVFPLPILGAPPPPAIFTPTTPTDLNFLRHSPTSRHSPPRLFGFLRYFGAVCHFFFFAALPSFRSLFVAIRSSACVCSAPAFLLASPILARTPRPCLPPDIHTAADPEGTGSGRIKRERKGKGNRVYDSSDNSSVAYRSFDNGKAKRFCFPTNLPSWPDRHRLAWLRRVHPPPIIRRSLPFDGIRNACLQRHLVSICRRCAHGSSASLPPTSGFGRLASCPARPTSSHYNSPTVFPAAVRAFSYMDTGGLL